MHIELDFVKKYKDFVLRLQYNGNSNRLGILGASGCGKSMTLKVIAGIITPDQGRIVIDDQVFYDSSRKVNLTPQERKIGYLFQNYALFPTMTVEENIAAGVVDKTKSEVKERVVTMIHRFALDGLEKRYPKELSGGQQQRVALARIMAYEPRLIMLDEPFSALDSFLKDSLKLEMKQLLKDYAGGMILVTHSRDEIYDFSEELFIMSEGVIVETGETKELFIKPHYVESARLTGCKNISTAKIVDEYHVYAVEWDMIFKTSDLVTQNITHVAVRANHLYPSLHKESNQFHFEIIEVYEKPFELTFALKRPNSKGAPLLWKVHKSEARDVTRSSTCTLCVEEKNVMLLM